MLPIVPVKKGKEAPILRGHPWIFSGAILNEPKNLPAGSLVDVHDSAGKFLARGYHNHKSQIRIRLLTWQKDEKIDAKFWEGRLRAAIERRFFYDRQITNAFRLVFSEADLLPGLIVDQYNDWLVVQSLTAGIDQHLELLAETLSRLTGIKHLLEKSDEQVRELEGLEQKVRLLSGQSMPFEGVLISENGIKYLVDIMEGQKTGFYLDQKNNRKFLRGLARDKKVLNCFCYTGGFSLAALSGGAREVVSVDISKPAIEALRKNFSLNSMDQPEENLICADVFTFLRTLRQNNESFDLIILDPPKFAKSSSQVENACRGYKDINFQAFQLLRPGGMLLTFSCSGIISQDLFQKIVFGAALDAKVKAQIIGFLSQAEDHPILLDFPESRYLTGLFCIKLS